MLAHAGDRSGVRDPALEFQLHRASIADRPVTPSADRRIGAARELHSARGTTRQAASLAVERTAVSTTVSARKSPCQAHAAILVVGAATNTRPHDLESARPYLGSRLAGPGHRFTRLVQDPQHAPVAALCADTPETPRNAYTIASDSRARRERRVHRAGHAHGSPRRSTALPASAGRTRRSSARRSHCTVSTLRAPHRWGRRSEHPPDLRSTHRPRHPRGCPTRCRQCCPRVRHDVAYPPLGVAGATGRALLWVGHLPEPRFGGGHLGRRLHSRRGQCGDVSANHRNKTRRLFVGRTDSAGTDCPIGSGYM